MSSKTVVNRRNKQASRKAQREQGLIPDFVNKRNRILRNIESGKLIRASLEDYHISRSDVKGPDSEIHPIILQRLNALQHPFITPSPSPVGSESSSSPELPLYPPPPKRPIPKRPAPHFPDLPVLAPKPLPAVPVVSREPIHTGRFKSTGQTRVRTYEQVICPLCHKELGLKYFATHMKRIHS